jgi:hypothetical protein
MYLEKPEESIERVSTFLAAHGVDRTIANVAH